MKYLFLVVLIGVIIFRFYDNKTPNFKDGDIVRITATVYKDPIRYETSQYIVLANLKIFLPIFPEINYGDKVIIEGVVNSGKLENGKLVSLENPSGLFPKIRMKIIGFYKENLPEPMAGLTAGIVLGSKGSITEKFWAAVKSTGTAHVVVASGTNVTFVTSFLISFLPAFLPRKKMIPIVSLGILFYLSLAGFEAPLVRAGIMSGSLFLSQEAGRVVSGWRILVFTALIMLVIKPEWVTDIGFILSFVSTASIMLFERRLNVLFSFMPKFLRESFSTSLAAQVGVTPILFVTFGQFNVLSPFINALVLWTVPYIMIFAVLGGFFGLLVPIIGKIVLLLSLPFSFFFTGVVEAFS